VEKMSDNTIWDEDLGVIASVNSAFPGAVVSPIASRLLENGGYSKGKLGNLDVYKTYLDGGNSRNIPLLINVDGNHVFASSALKESYAETLMTAISR
jgi:hypothetical protein